MRNQVSALCIAARDSLRGGGAGTDYAGRAFLQSAPCQDRARSGNLAFSLGGRILVVGFAGNCAATLSGNGSPAASDDWSHVPVESATVGYRHEPGCGAASGAGDVQ